MTEVDSEPDLPKVAGRLGLIFAVQVFSMLLIVAGGIVLLVTFAHNNSLSCTSGFEGFGNGPCHHRSYALPIGLLAGGFGLLLVGMVVSTRIALRTGASVLGSVLARRPR